MSATEELKTTPTEVEIEHAHAQLDHGFDLDEKAKVADYKADAIEAENAEHAMGVMEAVRAYPMASFWAFVMSCTIVSFYLLGKGSLTFTFALAPPPPNRS